MVQSLFVCCTLFLFFLLFNLAISFFLFLSSWPWQWPLVLLLDRDFFPALLCSNFFLTLFCSVCLWLCLLCNVMCNVRLVSHFLSDSDSVRWSSGWGRSLSLSLSLSVGVCQCHKRTVCEGGGGEGSEWFGDVLLSLSPSLSPSLLSTDQSAPRKLKSLFKLSCDFPSFPHTGWHFLSGAVVHCSLSLSGAVLNWEF